MKRKGFTLIELVTVIVLLGILAAVAVPRFINVQEEAREAQREQLRAQISSAINMQVAKNIAQGSSTPIPAQGDLSTEILLNEVPDGLTYSTGNGTFTYAPEGGTTLTMVYTNVGDSTWTLSTW